MKSWRNKVPLFFGFGAYLTLFWVPAFGTLANLEMHFFQKDLVKPIWKLAKFNLPLPKHQFKSIKPQVPGLRPWCHVWWRVGLGWQASILDGVSNMDLAGSDHSSCTHRSSCCCQQRPLLLPPPHKWGKFRSEWRRRESRRRRQGQLNRQLGAVRIGSTIKISVTCTLRANTTHPMPLT